MTTTDERYVDPLEEMNRIAQNILNLESWGFSESYRSVKAGNLIYDSEWCRVKLVWGGWDYLGGNSIQIRYGRLHAKDDLIKMVWNGEECRCWHDVSQALHFLDNRAPAEAAKLNYSHPLTDSFYEEAFRKQFERRQPEWLAQMHLAIWHHYGHRLFELFDLRRPQLWQQYRGFLKEVFDIAGRSPVIKPSLDKAC